MRILDSRTIARLLLTAFVAAALSACATTEIPSSQSFGIRASGDPQVIERGRYLVRGPGHCGSCHGDPAQEARMRAGVEIPLSGGRVFDLGMAGSIVAPNITPDAAFGIGSMTDDEIVRSLRYGISRSGRPLAPFMSFAELSNEDLRAILSYLRAQQPVAQPVAASRLSWFGTVGFRLVLDTDGPESPPPKRVSPSRTAEYGRYLAYTVANCNGCHTRRSRMTGAFVGQPFAGGMRLEERTGTFVSTNLTPVETGTIGHCSEEQFIALFRIEGRGRGGSPMPWEAFARMTDDDLGAIYRYLRTLEPVRQTQSGQ